MDEVIVCGEGPIPAEGLLTGQNPGAEEVLLYTEHGLPARPFIGPAGREQDEYLRQVNLSRSQLFLTNAFHYYTYGNRRPTIEELESDRGFLLGEIKLADPRVIGGVGECASEWLSRLAGQPFRDLESEHAIPRYVNLAGRERILVPLYHPALGLHSPESMGVIFYDYQVFSQVLKEELGVGEAEQHNMVALPSIAAHQLKELICAYQGLVAVDTEGTRYEPWGLTFSVDGIMGVKIGVEEKALLGEFNTLIHKYVSIIILQNSLHDIPVLLHLGVDARDLPIIDTMVLAHNLCVEPQGLKALGWRWLRIAMQGYRELADPVTERKAKVYLEKALDFDWDVCPECGEPNGARRKHPDAEVHKWSDKSVWLTPKGNVRKRFLPHIEWCPGGAKDYPVIPLNKRLQKILDGSEHDAT